MMRNETEIGARLCENSDTLSVGEEGRTSWKVMEGHGKSWNLMEGSVSVTKYDLEVSQNF